MTSGEEKLLESFRQLDSADQSTLLAFAEFLAFRSGPVPESKPVVTQEVTEPEAIPRPAEESVVAAVKRLSKTYPMINKNEILAETSDLVSQHVIQRREAAVVIDDLEIVFEQHYRKIRDAGSRD